MTCGFAIAVGGTTDGISVAFAGGVSSGFGDAASIRGLKRIFPTGGASTGASPEVDDGVAVNAGSSSIVGTPAGAWPSAGRSRGFSRRPGGGGACSSLIRGTEPIIRAGAKGKKFPSRSWSPVVTFKPVFNMIKAFLFTLCIASLCWSSGCLFSKKGTRAKESSAISADVEESFRRRWVDKRAAELTTQDTAADVARTKAEAEFRERYGFTGAGKK